MKLSLCSQCFHVITEPICPECFGKQAHSWINDYENIQKVFTKELKDGLNNMIWRSHSLSSSGVSCIICFGEIPNLCFHCLMKEFCKLITKMSDTEMTEKAEVSFDYVLYEFGLQRD